MVAAVASASQAGDAVIAGGPASYTVAAGDTIAAIAARFGVTVDAIVQRNQLRHPDRIVPGQTLAIDNAHIARVDPAVMITINVAQRMLFLAEDGGRVSGYPITVGRRDWQTPLGRFTITEKERDPVWQVPRSIQREMEQQGKPVVTRVEPSADNPLGAYWMRLSIPGLGIHGTNAPSSIYRYASHGCIRMHPDHIAAIYERVPIGAAGVLLYQPVLLAMIDGRVWIEAHPDPYRLAPNAEHTLEAEAARRAIGDRIDWAAAAAALRERAGRPVDVTAPRQP